MVEKEEMPIGTDTTLPNIFFQIKRLDSLVGKIYAIVKSLVHNGDKSASFGYHNTRRSKFIPLLLLAKPDPLRWAPIWFWVQTWRLHLFWHHSPDGHWTNTYYFKGGFAVMVWL